jgi:hypothetical protein
LQVAALGGDQRRAEFPAEIPGKCLIGPDSAADTATRSSA